MTIGFLTGAFDLVHLGHIKFLEDCKSKVDYLIVATNTEPSQFSNPRKTFVQTVKERVGQLKALRAVDEVVTYTTEEELHNLLETLKYDIRFLGSDWKGKQITGHDIPGHLEKCQYHDRSNHKFSSTDLKFRVYEDYMDKHRREFLKD